MMYTEVKTALKTFCESLRELAMKIINFKKKKDKVLNKGVARIMCAKICYICREKFENKYLKDKKYHKAKIIVIIKRNIEVLCIEYVI